MRFLLALLASPFKSKCGGKQKARPSAAIDRFARIIQTFRPSSASLCDLGCCWENAGAKNEEISSSRFHPYRRRHGATQLCSRKCRTFGHRGGADESEARQTQEPQARASHAQHEGAQATSRLRRNEARRAKARRGLSKCCGSPAAKADGKREGS